MLEVGGDDDSPPILFVEFVIAVDIIDGDGDGAVVLLDVAKGDDVSIIVGGYVGDENVCVVDVAEDGTGVV